MGRHRRSRRELALRAHERQAARVELLEPRQLFSTIYVDGGVVNPTHDGIGWATAYTDLQQALSVAVSGDRIDLAHGTYKPTATTDRTISFNLKSGVGLYGGYAGYGAPNPDARDVVANATVLSGDIGTIGTTSDNAYHVVSGAGVDSASVLDGVTITAGDANWPNTASPYAHGGGIYLAGGSSPIIRNCIIQANNSMYGGGGAYLSSSSPILFGCVFVQNTALNSDGGAVFNTSSSPAITNCIFNGNAAFFGGGIYDLSQSSPTLVNCAFSGNKSSDTGGGIQNESSSATLTNCTFSHNTAVKGGGAIATDTPSSTLTNCVLWGDTAQFGIGEIYQSPSTIITYSDIQGGFTGTGNLNIDPQFVRSPSPGGDGTWGTADDDYGDLRLQATSPCINAGSNAAVPAGVTTDLAGNRRIIGPSVDMGAYEYGVTATVTGTSGNDSYYLRQSADGSALQVWAGTAAVGNPAFSFAASTLESCTFDTGLGNDRLTVDVSNGLLANIDFLAGGDNDKLFVTGLSASADLNVQPGWLSLGAANVTSTDAEGTYLGVTTGTLIKLNSLNVADSLALPAGEQLVLDVSQLAMSGSGKLDLNDSDLIVRNGNLAAITSALQAGFNQAAGGYWNGSTGIISTAAATDSHFLTTLGVIQKTGSGTFDGQAVNAGDVLVKYTYYGDADLSGKVDGTDYSLIDVGYNSHGVKTGWQNGDFNYDGKIDGSDYSLIDNAFNMQGTSLSASPSAALGSLTTESTATFSEKFVKPSRATAKTRTLNARTLPVALANADTADPAQTRSSSALDQLLDAWKRRSKLRH
jgi:predicted outer membrane repeat protein